jgi:hypothetical protein
MHYQVSRDGQMYGPYTLDDLRRYVASGNVLGSDLAKSSEMADWVPVGELLAGTPEAESSFAAQASELEVQPADVDGPMQVLANSPYPDAPGLHWGLVLLFGFVTSGFFMPVWNLIVAAWLKRVQPNSSALYYYIAFLVIPFVMFPVIVVMAHGYNKETVHPVFHPMVGVFLLTVIGLFAIKLIARFSERASLEEHFNGPEPVGLRLSPVMTFFFGGIYFQYHLNRITELKRMARFQAGRGV